MNLWCLGIPDRWNQTSSGTASNWFLLRRWGFEHGKESYPPSCFFFSRKGHSLCLNGQATCPQPSDTPDTSPHVCCLQYNFSSCIRTHIVISSNAYHELISLVSDFIIFHVPILGKVRPVWQYSFSWVQITIFMHVYIVQMCKYDKYEWSEWNKQSRHPFSPKWSCGIFACFFSVRLLFAEKKQLPLDTTPKQLSQFDTFFTRQTPDIPSWAGTGTVHLLVICAKSDLTPKPQDKKALDPLCFDVFCLSLSELQYYFNRREYVVVSNTEIFQKPVVMMVLQHFRDLNNLPSFRKMEPFEIQSNSQTKGHVPPFQVEHPLLVFSQWKAQLLLPRRMARVLFRCIVLERIWTPLFTAYAVLLEAHCSF